MLQILDDTAYYRIEDDNVFVIEHTDDAAIKFDLSAETNMTWMYNSYRVSLISKNDTININNHKITNCYHFYFDVPVMVDEEHCIWLAPEIGFIQEQCGFNFNFTEKSFMKKRN